MATENRGVMVYLPSELEAKIVEYCTEHNITRKDKHGNVVTSLGSGIVAYLKSQLLGDIPIAISSRPNLGLTRDEVLDLIAESNTSNGLSDRSPDPIDAAVVDRLETIEQKLSSSTGMSRDEVEKLIQASEQKIMAAVRSMSIELRRESIDVKTINDRVNTPQSSSSSPSQDRAIEKTVRSSATDTRSVCATSIDKPLTKDIKRWLEPLKDKQFSDIIQTAISEELSNKEIVTRLFAAGYGKNENTETYPPNLASAMKTALKIQNSGQKESTIDESYIAD